MKFSNKIKIALVVCSIFLGAIFFYSQEKAKAGSDVCNYFSPYGQTCVGVVPVDCLCPIIVTPELENN